MNTRVKHPAEAYGLNPTRSMVLETYINTMLYFVEWNMHRCVDKASILERARLIGLARNNTAPRSIHVEHDYVVTLADGFFRSFMREKFLPHMQITYMAHNTYRQRVMDAYDSACSRPARSVRDLQQLQAALYMSGESDDGTMKYTTWAGACGMTPHLQSLIGHLTVSFDRPFDTQRKLDVMLDTIMALARTRVACTVGLGYDIDTTVGMMLAAAEYACDIGHDKSRVLTPSSV